LCLVVLLLSLLRPSLVPVTFPLRVVSSLFPYTTLFRSGRRHDGEERRGPQRLRRAAQAGQAAHGGPEVPAPARRGAGRGGPRHRDRKSTRLNSSHVKISYAVFCLKKKKRAPNGPLRLAR